MKRFLIERNIPGAGSMTPEQLRAASQKSCSVLLGLGPQVQWVQSYVSGDHIHCVYLAETEDLVHEHARQSGFPADRVIEISTVIDPTTAN